MKRFTCPVCGNEVHFHNLACVQCGTAIGYQPASLAMEAVGQPGTLCANAGIAGCNWFLPPGETGGFCLACIHNHVVPDISFAGNRARWAEIEFAKRQLLYAILQWNLPHPTRAEDPDYGLAFDFLADVKRADGSMKRVLTGHDDGLITINIDEGDTVVRVERQSAMEEPYRTVIGHMRHEIGHFYWTQLVEHGPDLDAFRDLFGDERADYAEALKAHYANGAPPDWALSHISSYATAHPWEDFAETWAHWMHIVDGLETAAAYGIAIEGTPRLDFGANPYPMDEIAPLIDAWVPITVALNDMNRGMGQPDLYPFVLSVPVVEKLRFINRLIHSAPTREPAVAADDRATQSQPAPQ